MVVEIQGGKNYDEEIVISLRYVGFYISTHSDVQALWEAAHTAS